MSLEQSADTIFKAIIIEDSRLARKEMLQLLKNHPEVNVIAQATNINEAQQQIEDLAPDLLFLDINMPGGDGFELLERLDNCPEVIFTTAYDDYAIKAFEFNAFDYLLKPINPKRLKQTLTKLILSNESTEEIVDQSPLNTLHESHHKIFVKEGEHCWLVDVAKIRYFESCGNYARLYFENNKPMIYKSLNKIEPRLQTKDFIRTNRQYIVNINFIAEVETLGTTGLLLTMDDGKEIEVSRRNSTYFKQLLSI